MCILGAFHGDVEEGFVMCVGLSEQVDLGVELVLSFPLFACWPKLACTVWILVIARVSSDKLALGAADILAISQNPDSLSWQPLLDIVLPEGAFCRFLVHLSLAHDIN